MRLRYALFAAPALLLALSPARLLLVLPIGAFLYVLARGAAMTPKVPPLVPLGAAAAGLAIGLFGSAVWGQTAPRNPYVALLYFLVVVPLLGVSMATAEALAAAWLRDPGSSASRGTRGAQAFAGAIAAHLVWLAIFLLCALLWTREIPLWSCYVLPGALLGASAAALQTR
jgi:hypothetical protein